MNRENEIGDARQCVSTDKSLFRNKYRIKSARLSNWDYSSNGYYFITICTHNRINWFGKIKDGRVLLSNFGKIIYEQWEKSFEIRPNFQLGEFIIMPNHIHGIVIIQKSVETHCRASQTQLIKNKIPCRASQTQLIKKKTHVSASLRREPNSISSFVGGFKSATIREIDNFIDLNNLNTAKFNKRNQLWQSRFYDHIIRNDNELKQISQYIKDNPVNWESDDLYFCGKLFF